LTVLPTAGEQGKKRKKEKKKTETVLEAFHSLFKYFK
jgi:hypothetical protein